MTDVKELADMPAIDASEVVVTPEMIEAGVCAFFTFDNRFEDADSVVVRIYRKMESLKREA
jgi:hypothetical protein